MKRILQIIPTLDRGGAARQMGLLASGLPREEFDVQVCALGGGGPLAVELRDAGIPATALGARWKFDPFALAALRRLVAQFRPDAIHAWHTTAGVYGRAAAMTCGVKHLVLGLQCVDPAKGRFALAVERRLIRRASRVVANSSAVKEFYVEKGSPADKIEVIAGGVLPIASGAFTRRQLLARFGLPNESRLVATVGPLTRGKRVKDAIWAADLLKVIRGDVHLLILGDGPHRDRLWTYRDQVEIRDKVHFLGDRGDIAQLLPHVEVLWSTSAHEGQSLAILEAMAAGVPVVATDVPGNNELVIDGQTGYLVGVGDRAGFARRANQLLDDAELARRLGQNGRQRAEAEFTADRMIGQYAALYRGLVA